MRGTKVERWRSGAVTWTTFVLVMILGVVAVLYIIDQNQEYALRPRRQADVTWYGMSPAERLEALGSGFRRKQ